MKTVASYILPVALTILGTALLIVGALQGRDTWVMLGAALALIAGVVALLLRLRVLGRRVGLAVGIALALLAAALAYRNHRAVAGNERSSRTTQPTESPRIEPRHSPADSLGTEDGMEEGPGTTDEPAEEE